MYLILLFDEAIKNNYSTISHWLKFKKNGNGNKTPDKSLGESYNIIIDQAVSRAVGSLACNALGPKSQKHTLSVMRNIKERGQRKCVLSKDEQRSKREKQMNHIWC